MRCRRNGWRDYATPNGLGATVASSGTCGWLYQCVWAFNSNGYNFGYSNWTATTSNSGSPGVSGNVGMFGCVQWHSDSHGGTNWQRSVRSTDNYEMGPQWT